MGYLRNWVRMLIWVGHKSVLIVGLVKSQLNMFFLSVNHMIPTDKNVGLLAANSSFGHF